MIIHACFLWVFQYVIFMGSTVHLNTFTILNDFLSLVSGLGSLD